jgi:hypothetical protein
MDLPSISLKNALRERSMNTIIRNNQDWYEETYIKRLEKPHEPKLKKMLQVGKIYSFMYDAKYKDELEFWNFIPSSTLCIGHTKGENNKMNAMCINTSYIPPQIRMLVMDKIVKVFNRMTIEPNMKRFEKNQFRSQIELPLFYDVCKKILQNSGFEFAIRSYIYTRMKTQPLIITYEDWWRVATLTNRYILKKNIRAIYALYKQRLDPKYMIGKKSPEVKIKNNKIKDIKDYLENRNSGK